MWRYLRTLRSLLNTCISSKYFHNIHSSVQHHLPACSGQVCARSPGDELGLLAHFRLEVRPGGGHVSSIRLHDLLVTVVEAADELKKGDGSVFVHVQPVKYPLGLGRGHLQLRADGEKLVFLDLPGVVHVVRVEESAQPVLLLQAHALDGALWLAERKGGVSVTEVDHRD